MKGDAAREEEIENPGYPFVPGTDIERLSRSREKRSEWQAPAGSDLPGLSSLKGDLGLKLVGETASDVGRHNGRILGIVIIPPGETPGVLLPELEVLNREMHAGKRFAH